VGGTIAVRGKDQVNADLALAWKDTSNHGLNSPDIFATLRQVKLMSSMPFNLVFFC
jgi:hypothetical protein